jgi:DNA adenine methylase
MVQTTLFDSNNQGRIINVASVPQRSPFRYPGGKTWLVPRIRQWLVSLPEKPHEFVEPFAGGGIVGLTVAFERLASHVTMVELDEDVASVWKVILNNEARWLADKIVTFDLNPESVRSKLAESPTDLKERAFQTILRNRIYRGGILAPGSGIVKYGENGKGIKSRWYPATLYKRILDIETVKNRIHFIEGDGLKVLREMSHRSDTVFFIDPPYTAAGKKAGTRLYKYSDIDHDMLFTISDSLKGNFLMTYDSNNAVVELAKRHGFDILTIPMKNTHHAEMMELLIGRNLDWARR